MNLEIAWRDSEIARLSSELKSAEAEIERLKGDWRTPKGAVTITTVAEMQTFQKSVMEKDAQLNRVTNDLADTLVELDQAEKAIERLKNEVEKMTYQAIKFQRVIQDQRLLLHRAADVMEGWHSLSRYELDLNREMREATNESTFR